MTATESILDGWTVRNMMRRDVVTVPGTLSVASLARLLQEHEISGAPVVDSSGSIVGVVSQSDIVREISRQAARGSPGAGDAPTEPSARRNVDVEPQVPSFFHRTDDDRDKGLGLMPLPPEDPTGTRKVAEIMMPARFSVRPTTSLGALARYLVNAKVHRALVMEGGALLGIVTTFDVLHALADSEVSEATEVTIKGTG